MNVKQLLNIFIIYIIQSIVYILFNIGIHQILDVHTQVNASLENLYNFLIDPIGHFWYLHVLIILYLIEMILSWIIVCLLSCIGFFTSFGSISQAMYELLYFECGKQIIDLKKIPMYISEIAVIVSLIVPPLTINIYPL